MNTRIIKINWLRPEQKRIKTAAETIEAGGLVVFPTETVYGIACAAGRESIARLDEVKERAGDKRYTLHISRPDDLRKYVPRVSFRVKKLIRQCWPGPVTIVFELDRQWLEKQQELLGIEIFSILYSDGTIGIRCPDNAIAKALLSSTVAPVVAPSANLCGRPAATDANEALSELNGKVDIIIDGGKGCCKYKKPSTVVKVTGKSVSVLREGVYTEESIRVASEVRILFVCTGNTCRSPMAEGFCRKYIAEKLHCEVDELERMGYIIGSAGTAGLAGVPASAEAAASCEAAGIDLSSHRSRAVSRYLVDESDIIFGMSQEHCDTIRQIYPEAAQKCMLLDVNGNIDDPIGGGQKVYQRCAEQIREALEHRISEIWDEDSSSK